MPSSPKRISRGPEAHSGHLPSPVSQQQGERAAGSTSCGPGLAQNLTLTDALCSLLIGFALTSRPARQGSGDRHLPQPSAAAFPQTGASRPCRTGFPGVSDQLLELGRCPARVDDVAELVNIISSEASAHLLLTLDQEQHLPSNSIDFVWA